MTDPAEELDSPAIDVRQLKTPAWDRALRAVAQQPGVTVLLGASDTGKTTCLRAAAVHLARLERLPLAIVDADIGQSTVGPPTTVGLSLFTKHNWSTPLTDKFPCHALGFIGAVSPVGHLLQMIVATKRLVDKALRKGAGIVLVDTTGLISQGAGFQLKLNKIELLEPRHILALQREEELEALLSVLSHRPGLTIHRLAVSPRARTRSPAERYRYRTSRFRAYFKRATKATLETRKVSVLSPPTGLPRVTGEFLPPLISLRSFSSESLVGYLVGLNNASNETLALGLIERVAEHGQKMDVLTPLRNFARVRIVQMANIRLTKTGDELGRPRSG